MLAVLDLPHKQFTHLNSMNNGKPTDDLAEDELNALKTHLNLVAGDTSIPWAPDQFADVPQQVGGVDCGVFTPAWSTCIGLGVDPAEVKQEHMTNLRQRLLLRLLLRAWLLRAWLCFDGQNDRSRERCGPLILRNSLWTVRLRESFRQLLRSSPETDIWTNLHVENTNRESSGGLLTLKDLGDGDFLAGALHQLDSPVNAGADREMLSSLSQRGSSRSCGRSPAAGRSEQRPASAKRSLAVGFNICNT